MLSYTHKHTHTQKVKNYVLGFSKMFNTSWNFPIILSNEISHIFCCLIFDIGITIFRTKKMIMRPIFRESEINLRKI